MKRILRLHRVWRDRRGGAALEFAFVAPVLTLLSLLTVDVGMTVTERMAIDQSLRGGAQLLMADITDMTRVENTIRIMAGETISQDDDQSSSTGEGFRVWVDQVCQCNGASAACGGTCGNGQPPELFYDLAAERDVERFLLEDAAVRAAMRVRKQ